MTATVLWVLLFVESVVTVPLTLLARLLVWVAPRIDRVDTAVTDSQINRAMSLFPRLPSWLRQYELDQARW